MRGMSRFIGTGLEGHSHIFQSIRDILSTPVGSRVMLRDYGSRIPSLVDRPQNELLDVELQAATAEALQKWEPRFKLTNVYVFARSPSGRVGIDIEGVIVSDGSVVRLEGIQF